MSLPIGVDMVHIEMTAADARRLMQLFDTHADPELLKKPWLKEVATILRRSFWRSVQAKPTLRKRGVK